GGGGGGRRAGLRGGGGRSVGGGAGGGGTATATPPGRGPRPPLSAGGGAPDISVRAGRGPARAPARWPYSASPWCVHRSSCVRVEMPLRLLLRCTARLARVRFTSGRTSQTPRRPDRQGVAPQPG